MAGWMLLFKKQVCSPLGSKYKKQKVGCSTKRTSTYMVMPFTMKDHTLAAVLKPADFYLFLPQLEDPDGAERDAGNGRVAPQLRVIFALLDPDPNPLA